MATVESTKPVILIADDVNPCVYDQLGEQTQLISIKDLGDQKDGGISLEDAMRQVNPRIIVVRSTKVQRVHMEAAPNLALIIRAGAGTNTIDKETATERRIHVANCPGKNAIAVAELTIGHILNMDRNIADSVVALRNRQWAKKKFKKTARGLYGRTVAILGVGMIGREVATRLQSFGMHVKGADPFCPPEVFAELGIERCETAVDCARGADVLTVHVPLNDKTRHMVNEDVLNALNDGAYVVNTSRGGVYDEAALLRAIESKGICAGLDVYENEPAASGDVFDDDAISQNPSIYGTHHCGASTAQASQSVGQHVVDIVRQFVADGTVINAVNVVV